MSATELRPFFQKRFVCAYHGYFDVMLSERLAEKFRPRCPVCKEFAEPREGYECTGKTAGPLPFITKPRIDESVVYEFPQISDKGFRQVRRGNIKNASKRRGIPLSRSVKG